MSSFHAGIDGHVVIPGTYTGAGGMTNFNIHYPPSQDRSTRPREPFSTVPFAPDPDFVDRPEILVWVRDKCAGPGARAALVGLGGVGKSQLAIQHAYRVYDAMPRLFVFWVHASTQARFEEAYQGIAERLQLPGRYNPKVNVLRLVRDWLCDEANGRWLMVVDNADDSEVFYPEPTEQDGRPVTTPARLATYLPNSRNGSILFTSRNKEAASQLASGYRNIREIPAMDTDQATQLLCSKLQDTVREDGAEELVRDLDCIPLAVTQAAAYINQRARMTISQYRQEFRRSDRKRESLLRWDADGIWRDETASSAVITTWQMSFDRIYEKRPSAADLLSLISFFNAEGISESMLQRYSRMRGSVDEEDADSAFERDFDTLRAYSLVTTTAEEDMCDMHALVQFCTRLWLSSRGEVRKWKEVFVQLMSREFPVPDFTNWATCQQLLPHVESLLARSWDESDLRGERIAKDWGFVLQNAARYMQTALSKYGEAEKLNRRALEGREKELGVQHPHTLASVNNLAGVLHDQGRYEEAESLSRRVLEGLEKELGMQHLDTLMSVNNLAGVLQDQGKYNEAEKLHRQALKGREKELGVQHLDTLASVNSLASVLQDQGKYDEAEKLSRRALEGREKKLGVQHPDTLTSISNLAGVLQDQGKYNEAEKLHLQALEGLEKALGVQHPSTLTIVNNIALVLWNQGKYDEAEKLHRQVLKGSEKELGVQHPKALTSASNLAGVLKDLRKYDEAEKLNRRALEGREKELGVQHPHTLASVNNLAGVLKDLRKYDEAEKLNRRALEGSEKELGAEHPKALTSASNLALVLFYQGKYDEAEKLSRRALEGREKELGVQHPDTLTSISNLAGVLHIMKHYAEAAELYHQAYEGRIQTLGPQHPQTIACRKRILALEQEQKSAQLAED
ncbi:TPR-like protein [Lentithecium fluviatile CBS 122367]|uniref:TPR-like protein n=1 Tax=Lentithecium fluviatile CBS 122367 TaxID=1168545 RepID=A0A6G1J5G9_9PLEO|nr:TPR-like protein [Lentithecium fluviatile CBS 122367]